ncbi:hypothetical protein [Pollutimonas bauzanensis]|jgi:hypothetical protein|uniref:hypothetical protein n=1 Tax=Pollutimonas bauzanensis TaxID=658167 RepID=UPI00333EDC80
MTKLLVSLIVEETYLVHFSEIVESCKAAGMDVQRQMTTVGVISGTIEASRVKVLAQIRGVRHVEESREVGVLGKSSDK